MKNICLYFQVHQPFRLRNFPFTQIGEDARYFDGEANEAILCKVARNCYLPANQLLLKLIRKHGPGFRVAFSISGTALDQFERYMPEVTESFKALADTGSVEFLAETYAHSLASLQSDQEFVRQVQAHTEKITGLFRQEPRVFRNTELIYNDRIAGLVADLGFTAMLTEGASQVLHWKSQRQLYNSAANPRLKLLLKHYRLSDDIAFRFSDRGWSEWPLTAGKFAGWLRDIPGNDQLINLFMDYETFGEHHGRNSGIFDFLEMLPGEILSGETAGFITPGEAAQLLPAAASLSVPRPVSWADEARDLSAWLGNDLQQDAFDSLYALEKKVAACNSSQLRQDWMYLQSSDHFYYMSTKTLEDGAVHSYFSPYQSPFDAFMNYMNILTDFSLRLDKWLERKKTNIHDRHTIET